MTTDDPAPLALALGRIPSGLFLVTTLEGVVRLDADGTKTVLADVGSFLISANGAFGVGDYGTQWLYVTTGLMNDHWVEIKQVHSGGSLAPGEDLTDQVATGVQHQRLVGHQLRHRGATFAADLGIEADREAPGLEHPGHLLDRQVELQARHGVGGELDQDPAGRVDVGLGAGPLGVLDLLGGRPLLCQGLIGHGLLTPVWGYRD